MKKNNELTLPALRAHMGDWVYYVTFLQMEEIANRIELAEEIHPSSTLKEMIQRQITNRAVPIAEYLLNQPQHFFNALIVGVYGGSPNWYELAIGTNPQFDADSLPGYLEGALGILRLDGMETLFALDGQHRVEGIKQALKKNEDLKTDEVSVIFVAHRTDSEGMERTRRLFTTLNRYAKPVKKSEIIALDEDDTIAIITRELVEKYPLFREEFLFSTEVSHHSHLDRRRIPDLFQDRFAENQISLSENAAVSVRKKTFVWSIIDNENKQTYTVRREKHKLNAYYQKISVARTKAIAPRDGNSITSIITLYDVLETVLREKGKRWNDFKKLRPKQSTISQYYNRAVQFWDTMIEHFPPLKAFKETRPGTSIAGQYRNTSGGHLLFRPVGLEIVASVIREAIDCGLSELEAIERVSNIPMDLADEPWVGLLWDKTNQRMLTDPTNKKVAKQLLFYMIGGDLAQMKTAENELRREYAGLLNRTESEVSFTRFYTSLGQAA
jgi:DNA sulfur modification protein DndB